MNDFGGSRLLRGRRDRRDRPGLVRDALGRVLGCDDPFARQLVIEAVAAAALVAAQYPGGRPVTSPYGPALPVPALPDGLREIAALALDRVGAKASESCELRELWAQNERYLHWRRRLDLLRRVLAFPTPQPVTRSWARIDSWMQRHAPASYALLAPPADPAEVEAAQEAMGVRFPADLLHSLACHDGLTEWANVFPDQPPMSVAGILDHWQMCVEIAGDASDPSELHGDEEPWWHPQWIPWAQSDGDSQIIDMREGPGQGRRQHPAPPVTRSGVTFRSRPRPQRTSLYARTVPPERAAHLFTVVVRSSGRPVVRERARGGACRH
ncbi:DUF4259 domain-containing protein [Streptomyces vinaceus]|uniref:DUF4259 domain-containing protein n=1 Tax=Streptomyces vinaceus TaxID=1960 RepID=UPI00380787EC